MHINALSGAIVDAAVEVHRTLGGPGLIESIYEEALAHELRLRGHHVARQHPVPVRYKGATLTNDLRIDLLVAGRVVVECKAVTRYNPVFATQALTYLRLTNLQLALVINFGERPLRRAVHRVVNGLAE